MPFGNLSAVFEWIQIFGYLVLFLTVAPLFPFMYVVMRWRSGGADEPGAGTYGAVLYFRTTALLITLAAASNLTYGWISTTPVSEELRRLSWGMLVGGLLFMALNVGLHYVVRPGRELLPSRRVFGGFLMIMAGLVGFTALVLLFIAVFQKVDASDAEAVANRVDEIKLWVSWAAYFLATYVAAVVLMTQGARRALAAGA